MPSRGVFNLLVRSLAVATLLPPVAAISSVSWAHSISGLLFLAPTLIGVAMAIALDTSPWRRFARWLALGLAPLVALGALYTIIASIHPGGLPTSSALIPLLFIYLFALGVLVLFFVMQLQQTWLAIIATWLTVAANWPKHLSIQQVWWMTWLLFFSLALLGVSHLRNETGIWSRFHLQVSDAVFWPTARVVALLCLFVAVVGILPISAYQVGALRALYDQLPWARSGPLVYHAPQGTPVTTLGAPLALNAPNVAGNTRVVSYTEQEQGLASLPPLLGATLDTFDGTSWRQSSLTAIAPPPPATPPEGAIAFNATITVYALPESGSSLSLLLGFDDPQAFSGVSVHAQAVSAAPTDPLSVAEWSTNQTLASQTSYTVKSIVLSSSTHAVGQLAPALQRDLTQTPADLTGELQPLALRWTAGQMTNYDKAAALVRAMESHFTADPRAAPPRGANAVNWFLQNKRGNLMLWTTTYILLGRSIGLPMRFAEGYLPGSFDRSLNQMVVTANDATIWAQLAIPGAGWVDFYPGANLIPISMPKIAGYGKQPTPAPTPSAVPSTQLQSSAPPNIAAGVVTGLGVLLSAFVLAMIASLAAAARQLRQAGARGDPLTGFFARLALLARWAGIHLRPSDTTSQATAKVARVVPEQATALREVNGAYERLRFGRPDTRQTVSASFAQLSTLWNSISRALRGKAVRRFLSLHSGGTVGTRSDTDAQP